MSFVRIALYSFSLLLLVLAGAGLYLYQNLPALVQQQATQYLNAYGLEVLNYENPQLSSQHFKVETLHLGGEYQGMAYTLSLKSLEVHYDWRALRSGQLQSATVGDLTLTVTGSTTGSDSKAADLVTVSELLPQPYLERLPIDSIAVNHWQLHYRGIDLPPIEAQGRLRLGDQLQLQLTSSYAGADLAAQLSTAGDEGYPNASIALRRGSEEIGNLNAALVRTETNTWQWALEVAVEFTPLLDWLLQLELSEANSTTLEALTLRGHGAFSARIDHPDKLHMAELSSPSTLGQFNVAATANIHIERLDYSSAVTDLHGDLDFAMHFTDGLAGITLAPTQLNARVSTSSLPAEALAWLRLTETVPVQAQNRSDIVIAATESGGWSVNADDNKLMIGDADSVLRWEALALDATVAPGDESDITAALTTRVSGQLREKPLPLMNLVFSHRGTRVDSEFDLSLKDVAQSMSAELQGKANLETGRGDYTVSVNSPDLPYASETLLPLLQGFGLIKKRQEMAITSGTASLQSKLQSQSFSVTDLTQEAKLNIENMSGSYNDYTFDGLTAHANWVGVDKWQTKEPVDLSIASLDMGFEVTDTRLRLSLPSATPITQPVVNIEALSADMFGGQVLLPEPHEWDFGAETNNFTLRAENWRLADLVALQLDQDIQARGTLEGELPVTVTGGRIIIANGYLQALAPGGHIRYIANDASMALASGSPELALALDLLDDFQYKVLSTRVTLDEAGNLLLGLSLEGSNPEQFDGRPINFNINLEQNIDPLLQSLRLSDKLVERLEERIN